MNKFLFSGLFVASQLLTAPSVGWADASVPAAEKELVSNIAQDGLAEVRLGQLAEEKSLSAEVKDFAKRMVADHTAANEKLKEAAKKAGVTLPATVNAEQKKSHDDLSTLSGQAFDAKYMAEMVKGHDKAVIAISKESETGTGELKQWAASTIATIKDHDKQAKKVNGDVKK